MLQCERIARQSTAFEFRLDELSQMSSEMTEIPFTRIEHQTRVSILVNGEIRTVYSKRLNCRTLSESFLKTILDKIPIIRLFAHFYANVSVGRFVRRFE